VDAESDSLCVPRFPPACGDSAEQLELAEVCHLKQRYAAAARFFADAYASQPQLSAVSAAGQRYSAACAAALAGCGQGRDAASLDAKDRSRLRSQALAWLRTDLTALQDLLPKAPKQARSSFGQTLGHWQTDPDLACVRDQAALAKLPEAERKEWANLWTEVAALSVKASSKK
jgi:hypothetical protein